MVEDSKHERETNEGARRILDASADIVGGGASGAVGAAIGFLFGGPIGAAVGGAGGTAVSLAIKRIGHEVSRRQLAPREEARSGAVLAIAAAGIQQRINDGEDVRQDGFFDPKETGRSDAEEVAESVVLKCQREPEEKKIPYMGHLLENLAFEYIDVHTAHQLIRAAEQLTYRQLCILNIAALNTYHMKSNKGFELRKENYRGQRTLPGEPDGSFGPAVLHECFDLYQKQFIGFGGQFAMGLSDIVPNQMKIQGIAQGLYYHMNLSLIPTEDLVPTLEQLR